MKTIASVIAAALLLSACGPAPEHAGAARPAPRSSATARAAFQAADAAFRAASGACLALGLVPARSHDATLFSEELSQAREVCARASATADAIAVGPAIPEPFRSRLAASVRLCGLAFAEKAGAFAALMKVANGDGSPATISSATRSMMDAHRDGPACMQRYAAATAGSGLGESEPTVRPAAP